MLAIRKLLYFPGKTDFTCWIKYDVRTEGTRGYWKIPRNSRPTWMTFVTRVQSLCVNFANSPPLFLKSFFFIMSYELRLKALRVRFIRAKFRNTRQYERNVKTELIIIWIYVIVMFMGVLIIIILTRYLYTHGQFTAVLCNGKHNIKFSYSNIFCFYFFMRK